MSQRASTWAKMGLNAVLVIVVGIAIAPSIGQPHHDFLAYWTAGRLNALGGNPYAAGQALAVQQSAGWPYAVTPFTFGYPPWVLPLMMPLGLLPYAVGHGIWIAFSCLASMTAAGWLWRSYGGSGRRRWVPVLLAMTFVPAFGALVEGQVTSFIFLGTVAFLYFAKRESWFWAGVAALALSFKPQLAYLFWPALLFWVIDRRQWRAVAGCAVALGFFTALAAAANPRVLVQAAEGIGSFIGGYADSLGLGTIMRLLFGADKLLLRLVPMAFGLAWLVWHWRVHRRSWDWNEQLPLLILVSVATTASSWLHDEILFVLPLIQAVAVLTAARRPVMARALAVYAALDLLAAAYFIPALYLNQVWFSWLPFAFLWWYTWSLRSSRQQDALPMAAPSTGARHAAAT